MDDLPNTEKQRFLSGLFTDIQNAETAYSDLIGLGYTNEEINVAMASTTRDKLYGAKKRIEKDQLKDDNAYNGTVEGSVSGGLLGGIAFAIGSLGSNLFIPGLGLVLMGPVVAGLLGAGAGALTGGLIGKLLSPEDPGQRADLFTHGLKDGKILLVITPHNQQDARLIYAKWTELNAEIIQKPINNRNND